MSLQISLYEITGIVSAVKQVNKTNLLQVTSVTTQKSYQISCPFFCPARKGDVISGMCIKENEHLYSFFQNPIVEPPSSRDAVQNAFTLALIRVYRLSKHLSDKLYDHFQAEALRLIDKVQEGHKIQNGSSESTIYRNKDLICAAVMETISHYANQFRSNPDVILPLMNVGLMKEQAEALLKWWYRNQVLRRLYLLGLTKKEIRESCERGWPGTQLLNSPDALYYQLIENPYLVEALPLQKADEITQRYNLSFHPDIKVCASLIRFVDQQTKEHGWACYPVYTLMQRYYNYNHLEPMLKRVFQCAVRYNFFYLRHQAQVEDILIEFLKPERLPPTYASAQTKKSLCEEQVQAVEMALEQTVSIITGSAGSGKSTVISSIESELDMRGLNYRIASFTGKAVSRLKELLRNFESIMTLHMMLNRPLDYNEDGTVKCEYLVIDEISQVPNELMAKLLLKLSLAQPKTRRLKVILVGDPNQIQPIDWGDLFNQILESRIIPRVHLKEDHRRAKDGPLCRNMRQFAEVEDPKDIRLEWGEDFQFIQGGIPELYSFLKGVGVPHEQVTIVSPYNRNLEEINQIAMSIFLPPEAPSITDSRGKIWRLGARVMMTKNRYDIKVMNGEEGIITGIFHHLFQIQVRFKRGQEVKIPTIIPVSEEDAEDDDQPLSTRVLGLAWGVTIDKAQGSEWSEVIFYLDEGSRSSSFLNRNRTYTGISRAKDRLTVIAPEKYIFEQSIKVDPPKRYDNLSQRLKGASFVDHYVDEAEEMYKLLLK